MVTGMVGSFKNKEYKREHKRRVLVFDTNTCLISIVVVIVVAIAIVIVILFIIIIIRG